MGFARAAPMTPPDGNGDPIGLMRDRPDAFSRQPLLPPATNLTLLTSISYTARQGRLKMSTRNTATSKPGFFARVFGGAGEVIEPDQKAIIIAVLLGMLVGVLT